MRHEFKNPLTFRMALVNFGWSHSIVTCRGLQEGTRDNATTVSTNASASELLMWLSRNQCSLTLRPNCSRRLTSCPMYVTPDHFTAVHESCDVATHPEGLPYSPADWWRALLIFIHMTGWRIGETMTLVDDEDDLDAGTALTRAEKN
jgi:hypothetical protein